MKVYTCTKFEGAWPVGTAAVVVAETPLAAALTLKDALRAAGLEDKHNLVTDGSMEELDLTREHAVILRDGNY